MATASHLPESSPLLISHIPKTAGTSLRNTVAASEKDVLFVYAGELALGNPNIEFIRDFRQGSVPRVVMGHFSYGAHRFLGVKPRYMTILREPIERVVSLFRHLRLSHGAPLYDKLRAGMSIEDFVASGETEQSNNHMCRCIAGIPPDARETITADWLLDLALHNLGRHYEIVGTLPRLNAALKAMRALMGWPTSAPRHDNVTEGGTPDVDERTRATIEEFNALDARLYAIVEERSLSRQPASAADATRSTDLG